MKKIVALGASNSKESINKKLAHWAASQVENATVELLDLNDFEMPIFSIDREETTGIPPDAIAFKNVIRSADGIVISFAEHNGNFSAAFKNVFDWISRVEKSTWLDKPMFLLATSPGARGGATVLDIAVTGFPFRGGQVIAHYSLPSFGENFSDGIVDANLKSSFNVEFTKFSEAIS